MQSRCCRCQPTLCAFLRRFVMFPSRALWISAIGTCVVIAASGRPTVGADAPIDFDRQIRPILSDNCFACHGPDAKARKANLRLVVKASAFGPAASGETPIVPGKAIASELLRRISSTDTEV